MVERSPEKAGVGGSSPSLATIFSTTYKMAAGERGAKGFVNSETLRYWVSVGAALVSPGEAS